MMKHSKTENVKEELVIDAIAMKQRIQEKFYEETKGLSAEELIAYMHRQIANSEFADFLSHPGQSPELVPIDR